jgi:NifB/MoaA-like Fe-S oxidoreductase
LAEKDLPEADNYDGYIQYENGVGMLRMLMDEVEDAFSLAKEKGYLPGNIKRTISMATGKLAYPYMKKFAEEAMASCEGLTIHVYPITNDFFGEMITVSGLLTGQDICSQLKSKELGEVLYLPENVLRSGEDVFLDDLTVCDVQKALQVPLDIVKSNGYELVCCMLGLDKNALDVIVED